MDEYEVVELQGKHGKILLHIPKKEPTKEDEENLYKTIAEVINNNNRRKEADK
ncbi:hypothetical protein BTS2_0491 [Bacillus sp. TS-2]|nr:hypothetical protein BTS2_0491 [Bacillus sp. TS-2]